MLKLNRIGFTIMEILIVVAMVVILVTLTVPYYWRSRINANESIVVSTLHTFSSSLHHFYATHPTTGFPASLTELAPAGEPPYLNVILAVAAPQRYGYNFSYSQVPGMPSAQYHIHASPVRPNISGIRAFYIDERSVVSFLSPAGIDPGHAAAGEAAPPGYSLFR